MIIGHLLEDAQSLLVELFNNTLIGLYLIQDERFVWVNPRMAEIFGYVQADICGILGPIDLVAPEDRLRVLDSIRRRMRGERKVESYEFRGLLQNGGQIDVEVYGTAIHFGGQPATMGLLLDVTDKVAAKRKLSEQLLFVSQLIDNIPNPVFYKDESGLYLGCNSAFERYIGLSRADLIGRSVYDISPKDLADKYYAADRALLDSPGTQVYEAAVKYADGTRHDVIFYKATVHKADNSLSGLVGIMLDITERKQAELALQRLNRELRVISDCNHMLVRARDEHALLDDICRIICNDAGYRMAWVGYVEDGDVRTLHSVTHAGSELGYLEEAFSIWLREESCGWSPYDAVVTGSAAGVPDFDCDIVAKPWRKVAQRCGYRSSISLPLFDAGGRVFGVLNIYAEKTEAFTADEQRLLGELAGNLAFGIVTLRAREEHRRAEEQIQIAATAFEAQEGIIITDANQIILRVNRAFSTITGYASKDVVGKRPYMLRSGYHDMAFYNAMWNQINIEGSWQGEILNRRKNGAIYPEWLNISAVKNAEGCVTHYVGTLIDITERKEAEKKIEQLAFYDALTGLPNRRLLIDRLQKAMSGSARSQHAGAVLFIDLDNFKIINDTCGHDIGDQLLIETSSRLKSCMREYDTIARLGGDEFVVMLEALSESLPEAAADAKLVATKIIDALNLPYIIADRTHHCTPSIGATLFVGHHIAADELLKQADIAMYQAKSAGRNSLRFFDPEMQVFIAVRATMEFDLRQAIAKGQFVLHYQPQVDSCNRVIGAEALLRWQHPNKGMIPPGRFIALAEDTRLILPIGQWVIDEACQQLAAWSREPRFASLQLAINVSARQFRQADFIDTVRESLQRSGAPATQLKLELTESLVLDNVNDTITKMQTLKELGVGFSMDDFGTGYSSLSYLTHLPLDQLKIDQSFVCGLPDNLSGAVVVQAIINLARSLGLAVIAEGVETEAQRQFLEANGCPVYQGFLFSPPVPLSAFIDLVC
ncbi:EAL domain-containing protein [Uliginosibacterium gangwonense]|uniref:EAL domain-containing protein n=1 Tax=Uliginosibacterium gangwonense TaxID=392736 RepID=UPI000370CA74|nr:EAL domain-containing protein [Uliginosibacterium gangwonense]